MIYPFMNCFDGYSKLSENVEYALDEADRAVRENDTRYTHEEVFSKLRRRINE